ncbi:hypothetical protein Ocin01_00207, partial [Orchesella cincta]
MKNQCRYEVGFGSESVSDCANGVSLHWTSMRYRD